MAKKLAYERYLWFHESLKAKKYPKITALAEKFEISRRQAAREIEFMRLFLGAPIDYSAEYNGYYYADDTFQFPGLWVSEEEIVSLVVARRLAAALPDRGLKKKFDLFLRKVSDDMDLDLLRLEEKVSLKNVRYTRVEPAVFSAVLRALVRERQLAITYVPGTPWLRPGAPPPRRDARALRPDSRSIAFAGLHGQLAPHRLVPPAPRGARLPAVSDRQAAMLADAVASPVRSEEIKEQIEERYGIFFDGPATPGRAALHPRRRPAGPRPGLVPRAKVKEHPDGSLLLEFPVADFREVHARHPPLRVRCRGAGTAGTPASACGYDRENGRDLP